MSTNRDAIPPFFAETKEISEDSLNLRIARPSGTTADSNLPVVVWLHGGGVVKGSAYDPHFDPDNLIKLSQSIAKPVIYVALNYRLTIFGFARLPILKDEKSLNVGMRDQRAGFQWVKDNIKAFGGDPTRITAFGLSAGGTFSSLHPIAFGGEKGVPFTQAWIMFGPPGTALNMSSDATTLHTLAVAEKLGCAEKVQAATLKCLRDTSMEKLLNDAMEYSVANLPPAGLFTFIPSVDGDLFPDRPSVLYKAGKFVKNIPMVFGWTQDDGAMNAGPGHLIQKEEDMATIVKSFAHALSDDDVSNLFLHYDPADFENELKNYDARKESDEPVISVHYFGLSRILRDLLFTCSSIDFGFEMSKQSRLVEPTFASVRLYDLNQSMLTPLWKGAGMPYVGVAHGSDTNYIFNGLFPEGEVSDEDRRLSGHFVEAFINFAYTGNPNKPEEKPEDWPEAFPFDLIDMNKTQPGSVNIQVAGGPYGTGSTLLSIDREAGSHFAAEKNDEQIIPAVQMGAMHSAAFQLRKEELERERLLQRCAYVNSLSEKLGI